jgi:HEPN domain-containing protein
MKPYESWMIKAYHDLISAKKLAQDEEPILDTAIYHTQQCAEKALKCYLSYKHAEELSPFATAYRYPDMIMEPEAQEVAVAIKQAEKIFDFVRQKVPLPDEVVVKIAGLNLISAYFKTGDSGLGDKSGK